MVQRSRVVYFDVLTILACLAVLFLHCNGIVHTYSNTVPWHEALAVEVLAYWAVPVFFMLTGAKTLDFLDRQSASAFLRKRFVRLFIPFLFWSVFLYIIRFSGWFGIPRPSGWNFSLGSFYRAFMECQIEPTYWFFYAMIGVTLSMPILSALRNNRTSLQYLAVLATLLIACVPTFCRIVEIPWNGDITIPLAGGYTLYVVLGYLLANKKCLQNRSHRLLLYCAGMVCLGFRYAYTAVYSDMTGSLVDVLFDYLSIVAVVPSAAIFILFRQLFSDGGAFQSLGERSSFSSITRAVSSCCFGIYIIHKIVLDNFLCGTFGISMDSAFMRLACPWILFALCFCIVWIAKRIPGVRRLVP